MAYLQSKTIYLIASSFCEHHENIMKLITNINTCNVSITNNLPNTSKGRQNYIVLRQETRLYCVINKVNVFTKISLNNC